MLDYESTNKNVGIEQKVIGIAGDVFEGDLVLSFEVVLPLLGNPPSVPIASVFPIKKFSLLEVGQALVRPSGCTESCQFRHLSSGEDGIRCFFEKAEDFGVGHSGFPPGHLWSEVLATSIYHFIDIRNDGVTGGYGRFNLTKNTNSRGVIGGCTTAHSSRDHLKWRIKTVPRGTERSRAASAMREPHDRGCINARRPQNVTGTTYEQRGQTEVAAA